MSIIYTPKRPSVEGSLIAFAAAAGILLLIAFIRLWYFQVVRGPELAQMAGDGRVAGVSLLAPRGLIFDRNGKLLAGVKPEIVVTAIPKVVRKNDWVVPKVASILGVSADLLNAKIKRGVAFQNLPTPIYVGADVRAATRIAESSNDLPGISVTYQPMRYYPDPTDFTPVLGYVWVPDQNDLKRLKGMDVHPADYVGKLGVEWYYEKQLMGTPGTETMELDKKGIPVRVRSVDDPVPGSQLHLAIDSAVQKAANDALKGKRGAVVAIDPSTGEVICLATSPSYDLSLFAGGISQTDYDALANNPDKPFQDRAVNGFFAPGSVFKIITSMAMQETGILNLNTTVFCDGGYHIGRAIVRCEGHHGAISYERAFEVSCNTYFCAMGVRAGALAIHKAALEAGLGQKTGIDLRSEQDLGFIPDQDNVSKVRKSGEWYGGDTANEAIGQGYVLVSPIQMADVACIAANRGYCYRPHLVHSITPVGGKPEVIQPEKLHSVDLPSEFWDELDRAMVGVIQEGTATRAQIKGITWAGKTGSAEHGHGIKTNAWFVGFAPNDHPKIAVAVLIQSAGGGGLEAAPVAQQVVKAYLQPPPVVKVLTGPQAPANGASLRAASSNTTAAR